MTKRQYLDAHRHKLAGLVLEAHMHPRSGAELSVTLRGLFARVDAILAEAWDDAHPADPAATDAPPTPAEKPTPTKGMTNGKPEGPAAQAPGAAPGHNDRRPAARG